MNKIGRISNWICNLITLNRSYRSKSRRIEGFKSLPKPKLLFINNSALWTMSFWHHSNSIWCWKGKSSTGKNSSMYFVFNSITYPSFFPTFRCIYTDLLQYQWKCPLPYCCINIIWYNKRPKITSVSWNAWINFVFHDTCPVDMKYYFEFFLRAWHFLQPTNKPTNTHCVLLYKVIVFATRSCTRAIGWWASPFLQPRPVGLRYRGKASACYI